jgi:hypothetical protein
MSQVAQRWTFAADLAKFPLRPEKRHEPEEQRARRKISLILNLFSLFFSE